MRKNFSDSDHNINNGEKQILMVVRIVVLVLIIVNLFFKHISYELIFVVLSSFFTKEIIQLYQSEKKSMIDFVETIAVGIASLGVLILYIAEITGH